MALRALLQLNECKKLKRPSHDKFLLANMSWPTLAFTRQTHVKSQHTPTRNMASVVQWHTPRVAALGLLLFYVFLRRNNKKRWRNIARQLSLGVYNTLVQELRDRTPVGSTHPQFCKCRANHVMSGRILIG